MNGVKRGKPFKVPELESAPLPRTRFWTAEEEATVKKYFRVRDIKSVAAYLKKKYPPGRSIDAIRKKGYTMEERNL